MSVGQLGSIRSGIRFHLKSYTSSESVGINRTAEERERNPSANAFAVADDNNVGCSWLAFTYSKINCTPYGVVTNILYYDNL